jgi:hypothetical protein
MVCGEMTTHSRGAPKTLGLIGTGFITSMQIRLWQGAMQAAQAHNIRLVFYPAAYNVPSYPFNPRSQVLFELLDADHVDGLLIWHAGILEGIGIEQGEHFFDRYAGIPLLTIGGKLKDYPDLSIDNSRDSIRNARTRLSNAAADVASVVDETAGRYT